MGIFAPYLLWIVPDLIRMTTGTSAVGANIQHLQAYVVPSMQFADPLGLAAARTREQSDAKVIADQAMHGMHAAVLRDTAKR